MSLESCLGRELASPTRAISALKLTHGTHALNALNNFISGHSLQVDIYERDPFRATFETNQFGSHTTPMLALLMLMVLSIATSDDAVTSVALSDPTPCTRLSPQHTFPRSAQLN